MTKFWKITECKCYLTALLLVICVSIHGQNLVPNPGFENYVACPTAFSQIYFADHWFTPTHATSDFFYNCPANCVIFPKFCVPQNDLGNQLPHSGNGYAGFLAYSSQAHDDYREYIQVQLSTPLVAGVTYEVSFYISLADNSQYATDEIGAYVSDTSIRRNDFFNFSCCTPQVKVTDVITDKNDWTLVSGCFQASGGESYLTIGNFSDFANTTITSFSTGSVFGGYYYIDDVSVTPYTPDNNYNVLGNDTILCQGETLTLDAFTSNATYLWQDSSAAPTFNVTQQGVYWAEVTVNNCSAADTILVNYNPSPAIDLGNDTTLCEGKSLAFDATFPNATYLWQDNSTNAIFHITQQGKYWAEITVNNCSAADTILVNYNPLPTIDLGNDTTLCHGEIINLDATFPNATYLWQNNSTNSAFHVTQQGKYWTEVSVNNCSTTDTILINYNPLPTIDLGNDTTLCHGEIITLDATVPNATYLWQDNSTNPIFTVNQEGTYRVIVTSNNCSSTDTINFNYIPTPNIDLGNDTILCQGKALTLDATTLNATYLWQDNSTTPTFTVTQEGTYWVSLTSNNCSSTDTINFNYIPPPNIDLGNDTTLCRGETLLLDATTLNADYLWQDNSTNPTFTVNQDGIFWVEIVTTICNVKDSIVITMNECEITLEMPNVFTPNGDSRNDTFVPITTQHIASMNTVIYNRWGTIVYETSNPMIKWDGQNVVDGTYFWIINGKDLIGNTFTKRGRVTVLR